MPISSMHFHQAYERFQTLHEARRGKRLESFADPESWAFEWEAYKPTIRDDARRAMAIESWQEESIGSGAIVDAVVRAIELDGNNLVQWESRQGPQSRVHNRMLEARQDDEKRHRLEALLFDLYRRRGKDETTFESLVGLCGKRYELLAYLFFLADSHRFLPIRTRTFDRALRELGVELTTEGQCGWANYQAFLDAMRDVHESLRRVGIRDATLLDAHSFCWILARNEQSEEADAAIPIVMFDGQLLASEESSDFTPRDHAPALDLGELDARKREAGDLAERIALIAEQQQLRAQGRADLADEVKLVSERPGLGFDLRSFEPDGTERFIEVKNVSSGPRFYLTHGEWKNSQARANYWFYLVTVADGKPGVEALSAKALRPEHLQPSVYVVSFIAGRRLAP